MDLLRAIGALLVAVISGMHVASAAAQDEQYIDDRSTAESVITSYYNAINRFEYARAYSYFGDDDAPDYDPWEFGYSDTQAVMVSFGESVEEGAAGSLYYSVPVRLDVERTEGQHAWYVGCYQLRLAQPAIQSVPFQPLHIVSADLHEAGEDDPLPETCS
jgi:hypothetical protein